MPGDSIPSVILVHPVWNRSVVGVDSTDVGENIHVRDSLVWKPMSKDNVYSREALDIEVYVGDRDQ